LPGGTEITPPAYIPFGIGPRACIGMKLAQMEAKLVLAHVMYHYRFQITRAEQKFPNLTIRAAITLSPADGVWVRVEKRRKPTAHYV